MAEDTVTGTEFIAALVEQSSRDLQWTNDQIQRYWKDSALRLARTIIRYEQIIDSASVIDRSTMYDFDELATEAWFAGFLLEKESEHI